MLKKALVGLAVLVVAVVAFGVYRSQQVPANLWIATGVFPACPSRPSCVSSVATDDVHKVEPISYTGDARSARSRIEQAARSLPNGAILHATPEYLHVLFLTPLMHFHDDVELLVQDGGLIQVRSISRFGYRDRGVNRARVEALRAAFAKAAP